MIVKESLRLPPLMLLVVARVVISTLASTTCVLPTTFASVGNCATLIIWFIVAFNDNGFHFGVGKQAARLWPVSTVLTRWR